LLQATDGGVTVRLEHLPICSWKRYLSRGSRKLTLPKVSAFVSAGITRSV
jgi:hypothetical protein